VLPAAGVVRLLCDLVNDPDAVCRHANDHLSLFSAPAPAMSPAPETWASDGPQVTVGDLRYTGRTPLLSATQPPGVGVTVTAAAEAAAAAAAASTGPSTEPHEHARALHSFWVGSRRLNVQVPEVLLVQLACASGAPPTPLLDASRAPILPPEVEAVLRAVAALRQASFILTASPKYEQIQRLMTHRTVDRARGPEQGVGLRQRAGCGEEAARPQRRSRSKSPALRAALEAAPTPQPLPAAAPLPAPVSALSSGRWFVSKGLGLASLFNGYAGAAAAHTGGLGPGPVGPPAPGPGSGVPLTGAATACALSAALLAAAVALVRQQAAAAAAATADAGAGIRGAPLPLSPGDALHSVCSLGCVAAATAAGCLLVGPHACCVFYDDSERQVRGMRQHGRGLAVLLVPPGRGHLTAAGTIAVQLLHVAMYASAAVGARVLAASCCCARQ
jgi:hypothetical protein